MQSRRARGRLSGIDIKPEALRQARVAAGLSLAQAGGVELTRQAVHLIETGKVRPSMRSLRVLAQRLQMPVATLLTSSNDGEPSHENGIAELDRLCRHHLFEQAVSYARTVLERARSPEVVAEAHYYMGNALANLARPQEALEHLREARALFEAMDDDHGRVAETLELEALALHIAEDDPQAMSVAQSALLHYRALDGRRPEVESRLLQRLGTILVTRREFHAAMAKYDEALELAGGVRDLVRLARLYHGLALCHEGLGDLHLASEIMLKAHTLYEAEERLAEGSGKSELARVENDMGMLVLRQGDLGRAENFLTSSISRFKLAGLERMRSHVLLTLGELRQRQQRFAEAIELVSEAVDFAQRFDESRALARAYRQLGELYAATGERERAEASFQDALVILSATGLEQMHAECMEARDKALSGRSEEAGGTIA